MSDRATQSTVWLGRRRRAALAAAERAARLAELHEPYRFDVMDAAGWGGCVHEAIGRRRLLRESIIAGRL